MKGESAMYNKYFDNITSIEELRKVYKTLLKQYHPDNGGSEEATKEINIEYERIFDDLSKKSTTGNEIKGTSKKSAYTADKTLREVLNKIINLEVDIEICGSWIWVSGNTYNVKKQLKAAGFRYSKTKKSWYWGELKSFYKKKLTMDDIRNKYGSEKIETQKQVYIGT